MYNPFKICSQAPQYSSFKSLFNSNLHVTTEHFSTTLQIIIWNVSDGTVFFEHRSSASATIPIPCFSAKYIFQVQWVKIKNVVVADIWLNVSQLKAFT